ncbi:MAG: TonB-dependent receptor [Sphingopyxis sp.]|nr:TonB-dependent receptor [Sphingopyxis sp.]
MTGASKLGLLAGSILATLSGLPTLAFAQDSGAAAAEDTQASQGGDIVVTARKRNERMIDVPETISAFSDASLQKAGINNLDKLGQAVPNIVLNRRGDNEPNVVIRGVGSFGNVQGIGFYIDDVQNFTDQASRLIDLERVEILKGPQGTLYGGSSIGGAVKYVTKKPSDTFEGRMSGEVGGQSILNVNASVNVPLSDMVAVRVSGYADTGDGFMKNPITRINNDKSEEYGFRGALRFTPSDTTDINLSVRYSYLNNGGNDYYITPNETTYQRESGLDQNIYNRRRVFGVILNVEQQIGDLSLTSLTSYTERKNRILWDLDYSALDGLYVAQRAPIKTRVFTQEVRLQSDNGEGFNWLVGGYYSRVRDRSLTLVADAVFGVDFGEPSTVLDFSNNRSDEKTYAGFANISYKSGPFEIALGARLNHNDFFGLNRLLNDSANVKDTVVLPKLTLSYKIDPALMLYFNASEGYEPARFTLFGETSILPYKAETARNFELGAKGQTDSGLLSYEVAGFYIKSKNRQLETLILDDSGVPNEAIGNVGDARTWGAEFSFTLRPTRDLSFNANGGYMNSKFTAGLFDGFRVPYAPRFSGGMSIDYTADISSALKLSLRADAAHNSGFFWNTTNTLRQESYDVVGGRIAIGAIDDKWELAVRADNLLNEKYHTELQPFDPDLIARRGQPRLIVGTVTVRF